MTRAEWVEAGARALVGGTNYVMSGDNGVAGTMNRLTAEFVIRAVEPLIRADERERVMPGPTFPSVPGTATVAWRDEPITPDLSQLAHPAAETWPEPIRLGPGRAYPITGDAMDAIRALTQELIDSRRTSAHAEAVAARLVDVICEQETACRRARRGDQ